MKRYPSLKTGSILCIVDKTYSLQLFLTKLHIYHEMWKYEMKSTNAWNFSHEKLVNFWFERGKSLLCGNFFLVYKSLRSRWISKETKAKALISLGNSFFSTLNGKCTEVSILEFTKNLNTRLYLEFIWKLFASMSFISARNLMLHDDENINKQIAMCKSYGLLT